MTIIRHLLLLISICFLSACFTAKTNEKTFFIDNPTDTTMKFTLDGQPYEILPLQTLTMNLMVGEHVLHFTEGAYHESIAGRKVKMLLAHRAINNFVLNPAGQIYVVSTQRYGNVDRTRTTSVLDGYEFYDTLTLHTSFYISKYYDLTLLENFPDTVSVDRKFSTDSRSKLFRLTDYIDYYTKNVTEPTRTTRPDKYDHEGSKEFINNGEPIFVDMPLPPQVMKYPRAAAKTQELIKMILAHRALFLGPDSISVKESMALRDERDQLVDEINELLPTREAQLEFLNFQSGDGRKLGIIQNAEVSVDFFVIQD